VTLETPNRRYVRQLRAAAARRPPSLLPGDTLLWRLQGLAEKLMLMKNGSEADVYDDVRNTLLEEWRVNNEITDADGEEMLALWFGSGRRREAGCLVYTVMFDVAVQDEEWPWLAPKWIEEVLKREKSRESGLLEVSGPCLH
jgi:hypothetical protein